MLVGAALGHVRRVVLDSKGLLPWGHEGPTKSGNGGPACGYHNRWKSTGYRTWHDPQGHWHHYRPVGTEIGWRADLNTTCPIAPEYPDATHNPAA
jgi:hypothetical protein